MALILSTGNDLEALKTRQKFLEKGGHTVVNATNERELQKACEQNRFDLVVVGQNLSQKMKRHVVDLIHEHCPDSRIVESNEIPEGWVAGKDHSWGDQRQESHKKIDQLGKAS